MSNLESKILKGLWTGIFWHLKKLLLPRNFDPHKEKILPYRYRWWSYNPIYLLLLLSHLLLLLSHPLLPVVFIFVLQVGMDFFSQIFFSEWNSSVESIIKWSKPVNFFNIFGRQDHFNFTPPPPIVSPPSPTVSPQNYVYFWL